MVLLCLIRPERIFPDFYLQYIYYLHISKPYSVSERWWKLPRRYVSMACDKLPIMHWIFVSSKNSNVEALTPSRTVFGDGASKVEIKVKWGHKGRALNPKNRITVLIRRNTKELVLSLHAHTQKKKLCEHTARRQLYATQNSAGTLILDFWTLELWANKFLLLQPTRLWHFVYGSPGRLIHSPQNEGICFIFLCISKSKAFGNC